MTLSFDPSRVRLPDGHWIGGRYVGGRGEMELHRPSDGVAYAHVPIGGADIVDQAVMSAKAALRESGWSGWRPRDRAAALHALAALMKANGERLGQLEAISSSRPISQSISVDVAVTAEQIGFFAELADKEGGDVVPTDADHLGMIMSEPYGVVGAITPWNVPLSMAGWKLGPALAAGNAVVIKPSEMTPFSTLYLAELAAEAGVPDGILNVVLGDGATTGKDIVSHPDIAKVSFTGSTVAGGAILKTIGSTQIKPVTLELGGKSPQIVFASADVSLAADCIARSIMANAGQACVAGTRVIADRKIVDQLVAMLVKSMSQFRPGPNWDEKTNYSPIISERQLGRIERIVGDAISGGAECVSGGERVDRSGYFYKPTILVTADEKSPAVTEEIFGPVLTVQTFEDEDEAFALGEHPTYALAAGVYSTDLSQALRAVSRVQAGTVWVNRYGRSRDHILPTGGYKGSGIGKDLGREAYALNRRHKSVLIRL